jgi:ribosomal protein S18 acetylase RimI-like enzyme
VTIAAPADPALVWRPLRPADVPAVDALHRRALATLADPAWVRPEEPAFFEQVLGADGFGIGVEAAGGLVAYGLVQRRLEPADAAALPWADAADVAIAKLCGAAVDPAWRGRGLQTELARARLARGHALGVARFVATAAPRYDASWASLLHAGQQVAALGPRYGGLLRYLLVADGRRPDGPAVMLALDATDAQRARLALGWRGTALRAGPPPALEFRQCTR